MCTVCEWSTEEVCLWLRELDLDEHCEAFKTHDMQGRELLTLARDDLKVSTLLCFLSSLTYPPYLTLPYEEGVLPPSTEASSGPNARPQINPLTKLQQCTPNCLFFN